jgi:UPF0042 nucleotide-binding protein
MKRSHFVIITGLSGAGKSQAIKCFEDFGFFCVDNLPTTLLPKFAEICDQSQGRLERVALGIDIREGEFLDNLFDEMEYLKENGFSYEILFLEARTELLINRFSETRRKHPLGRYKSLRAALEGERRKLAKLRRAADHIIDTSDVNIHQLKSRLTKTFAQTSPARRLSINMMSFGYRYGVPAEVDMVFDVRFLANPNYVPHLKQKTGNHKEVIQYVLESPISNEFIEKLKDILEFLLPQFTKEGKSYFTLAFGCTGGRHRSVVFANLMAKFLQKKDFDVSVSHRDIRKNDRR